MLKLSDLVDKHREILATIETWDNGKPYTVARDEDLVEVAETIRYYAGFADKVFGQVIETTPEKFAYTLREPVGVCGQIIPYRNPNLPLFIIPLKADRCHIGGITLLLWQLGNSVQLSHVAILSS